MRMPRPFRALFGRGRAGGGRPRVLYFIVNYPTFSETYMHEEIRALREHYEIRIVTYRVSDYPRRDPFPYEVVEYPAPCLVYGRFPEVDRSFDAPEQREFLAKIDAIIAAFAPDVLHGHYFGLTLLLRKLAERHGIPYTLRTHSMDVLSEPPAKIQALCEAANDPLCLRVLAFPARRAFLVEQGLAPDKVVSCWPVINFARFHKPERRAPTRAVMCAGPIIRKKAHVDFVRLAALMRASGMTFDLYGRGDVVPVVEAENARGGNVIGIRYEDPDDMAAVYPRYDWLVYPSDPAINKVGLPASIAEAQASGLGVCWQELPGRREEQEAFLGGAGFLYRAIEDVPAILAAPYPETMRLRGLENARKCDIAVHKRLLTDAWATALEDDRGD